MLSPDVTCKILKDDAKKILVIRHLCLKKPKKCKEVLYLTWNKTLISVLLITIEFKNDDNVL